MPTSTVLCIVVAVVIAMALVAWGEHPELWNMTLAFAPQRSMAPDPTRSPYPTGLQNCSGDMLSCSGLLPPFRVGGAGAPSPMQWSTDPESCGHSYAARREIWLNRIDAECFFRRGLMYFAKRDDTQAIADFSAAIRLDATNALAYKDRGEAYADRGNYSTAIADFNNAIRLDPGLAAAFAGRGRAYLALGKLALAQSDFAEAGRLGETSPAPAPTADRAAAPSPAPSQDPDDPPRSSTSHLIGEQ